MVFCRRFCKSAVAVLSKSHTFASSRQAVHMRQMIAFRLSFSSWPQSMIAFNLSTFVNVCQLESTWFHLHFGGSLLWASLSWFCLQVVQFKHAHVQHFWFGSGIESCTQVHGAMPLADSHWVVDGALNGVLECFEWFWVWCSAPGFRLRSNALA